MTTAKAILGAAATLILGWVGFTTMSDEPPADPAARPSPPRRVSVRLLGLAEEITGIAVPAQILAGQRPRFFQIDEPSVVVVTLPGDRTISLLVKTAFVNTEIDVKAKSAVVVDVDLLPLPKSVPYREAVAELRRLMRKMKIEPDEQMRKQMAAWPDDLPRRSPDFNPDLPFLTYSAGMWISEIVGLSAGVRPTPDGGWFVAFVFAVHADARRPLWDPNFKPKSRPRADEKDEESAQNSSRK